jgi:hypothetical protein
MATHSGLTSVEFTEIVRDWIATAKHPVTGRLYTEMVYQPMLESVAYLNSNGFNNFIVSGGGIDFMRPWTDRVYGIVPEEVVGSSGKTKFEMQNGKWVLMRLPEISFIDDGPGKPVGINDTLASDCGFWQLRRRPSDARMDDGGQKPRSLWAASSPHRRCAGVGLYRDSTVGKLEKALDAATAEGWTVMRMKDDWNKIFPFGNK